MDAKYLKLKIIFCIMLNYYISYINLQIYRFTQKFLKIKLLVDKNRKMAIKYLLFWYIRKRNDIVKSLQIDLEITAV